MKKLFGSLTLFIVLLIMQQLDVSAALNLQQPTYSAKGVRLITSNEKQIVTDVVYTVNDRSLGYVEGDMLYFTGKRGILVVTASRNGETSIAQVVINPTYSLKNKLAMTFAPQPLTAIATYSDRSTKEVTATFKTTNSNVVKLDGDSAFLTGVAGQSDILATIDGETVKLDTVTVKPLLSLDRPIAFSFTPIAPNAIRFYGQDMQQSANVKWTSNNDSVVKIVNNTIAFTGQEGAYVLTGIDEYGFKVEAKGTIAVRKQLKPFMFTTEPLTLQPSFTYNNTVAVPGATSFTSDNPQVATVSTDGVLRFTGELGKVTITAQRGNYRVSQSTTVNGKLQLSLSSLTYTKKKTTIRTQVLYSTGLKRTVRPLFTSSNPKVVTVSTKGDVTFTGGIGTGVITVQYGTAKATIPFKVDGQLTIQQKSDTKLLAWVTYPTGDKVAVKPLWKANPKEALVDENGNVKLIAAIPTIKVSASYGTLTAATLIARDMKPKVTNLPNLTVKTNSTNYLNLSWIVDGAEEISYLQNISFSTSSKLGKISADGLLEVYSQPGTITIQCLYGGRTFTIQLKIVN